MMSPRELIEHLFVLGMDVMVTTINGTTKAITAQLGDAAHGQYVDSDEAEWWGVDGVATRPASPTQTGGQQSATACQAIAIKHSTHDKIIATRDLRWSAINADLEPGDCALYARGPSASDSNGRVVCRASGAIELRSTQTVTVIGSTITLGTTASPDDFVALASKVDGNFSTANSAGTALANTMAPLIATPPATPAQVAAALETIAVALQTFGQSLSFNPTGSTKIKAE